MFEAGTKENVIPERATITIDWRFLPEENIEEIDAEIDALLTDVESEYDVRTSWKRTRMYESAAIDTDSPLATIFWRHSEAIADVSTEAWGITASTDVRDFVNDADVTYPAVNGGTCP